MIEQKSKRALKCPRCDYEWMTRSQLRFVSCPSCLQKVLNEDEKE